MSLVEIANPQTGAEVLENFRRVRTRIRTRPAVPDHGIEMRNGWPVKPAPAVVELEPEPPRYVPITDRITEVTDVTPEAPLVEKRIRIEEIQLVVAEHYNVSRLDILSARRTWNIVLPRHVAMYLAKTITMHSLPEIGRRFGGRDHTAVLHAVRKIERLRQTDAHLDAVLNHLTEILGGVIE